MEQYTIKDLMERYNLKTRQSIYQWCDGLNLKLHKGERNRAYATPEQVEQLDQLKEHLDKGGTIASFTPVIDTEIDTSSNLVHQSVDFCSRHPRLAGNGGSDTSCGHASRSRGRLVHRILSVIGIDYIWRLNGVIFSVHQRFRRSPGQNLKGRNGREERFCLCERGKSALRLRGEW